MIVVEVELIEAGRKTFQEYYPQGTPYQIHQEVDGKPTIAKSIAHAGGTFHEN